MPDLVAAAVRLVLNPRPDGCRLCASTGLVVWQTREGTSPGICPHCRGTGKV